MHSGESSEGQEDEIGPADLDRKVVEIGEPEDKVRSDEGAETNRGGEC